MISLKNVTVSINKNDILNDINAKFEEKNIYCVIGENGSGKTILLKTILGFIPPDSGEVLVENINIYKNDMFAPNSRAVLENAKFIKELTGFENIKLLTQINNLVGDNEIKNWFEKLDLEKYKDEKIKTYSLGMIQKLALIQVFVEDPKIIILDEPFNGLDKESVDKLKEILIEEKNKGKIIILTSHIDDNIKGLYNVYYKVEEKELNKIELLEGDKANEKG